MEYVDAEIPEVWRRGQVKTFSNKGINSRVRKYKHHRLAKCRSMAATGTSGMRGDDGKKRGFLTADLGKVRPCKLKV
ncbi:hypothetical protein DPMN_174332 [Dreissena polymorpha]|uniref:Uncharacterized protein n=1 Tax=Dreissena polymorpha TaxID=45954 RepID=A0A9D4IH10_DREPO|nr:hypothetical protein DPMN_174332 [Dreissena polymorpha]